MAFETKIPSLLGLPQVEELTGLSKPTIYRGMKSGIFPLAIKISVRRIAWRSDDIQRWLDKASGN